MFNDTAFWLKYNISRGFYFSLILMYCQSNVLNVIGSFFFIHVEYMQEIMKKWGNTIFLLLEIKLFYKQKWNVL